MAKIIKADGTVKEVEPKNGKDFKLEELSEIVGGFIEVVYFSKGSIMVVNEEGKLDELPVNVEATKIINKVGIVDIIVGDVLVCKTNQVK